MAISQIFLDLGFTEGEIISKLNQNEDRKTRLKKYAAFKANREIKSVATDILQEIEKKIGVNNAGGSEHLSRKYFVSENWIEELDAGLVESINTLVSEGKI